MLLCASVFLVAVDQDFFFCRLEKKKWQKENNVLIQIC